MPRYYHDGSTLDPPAYRNKDGHMVVKIPSMFTGGKLIEMDCPTSSVLVSMVGHGFYVVPPGGFVELKADAATVKMLAPHLMTEEDYLIKEAAKKPKAAAPAPAAKASEPAPKGDKAAEAKEK